MQAQGKRDEAVACYRRALELKPDYAAAHNNLGAALQEQGKQDEAVACFRRALELNPDFADAHNNLGAALQDQGKWDDAIACFRRALELKPDFADALNNLGAALQEQGNWDDAIACFHRALELKPDYADAHNNLGTALAEVGDFDGAMVRYREALAIQPDHADAHFNLALALLIRGQLAEGWREYEWRWKRRGKAEAPLPQPRWNGEPLAGRTILLRAEQGLGDTLQFVRYARLLKEQGARVVVEAQPALVSLVQRCADVDQVIEYGGALGEFDFHLPLLSLPAVLRTTLETIPADVPYLTPDEILIERLRAELAGEAPSRSALPGRAARRIPAIACARFRSRTLPASPDWRGSGSTVCSPAPDESRSP